MLAPTALATAGALKAGRPQHPPPQTVTLRA
jgi:hypothetical protein